MTEPGARGWALSIVVLVAVMVACAGINPAAERVVFRRGCATPPGSPRSSPLWA